MGSPHVYPGSNYKGYEKADATKVVGNLRDKMFLLIHGTADDNVHYHHSMMLAAALVHENVLFQQMVKYPNIIHINLETYRESITVNFLCRTCTQVW